MTKYEKTNQVDIYRPVPEPKPEPKRNWWKSAFEWLFAIGFWIMVAAVIVELTGI